MIGVRKASVKSGKRPVGISRAMWVAARLFLMTCVVGCSNDMPQSIGAATPAGTPLSASFENSPAADGRTPGETAARFHDITGRTGIDFMYRDGQEAGHATMLESLGGGLAAVDYDLDGAVDLFFPGGGRFGSEREISGEPSALYRNRGNAEFLEVTISAGVGPAAYYSHGANAGDYDNDGFPDILLTGYGGLMLYHNQGDGTFCETAVEAGLTDDLWSSSAAWGDLNGDGFPDLYVVHYVDWSWENNPLCPGPKPGLKELCSPKQFGPLPDTLYLSQGDGTFRDATEWAGLRKDGKGLGVILADVDLDGFVDIYVGNDGTPNFLYFNDGAARFEERGLMSGVSLGDRGDPDGSMGVDLGDFNLDGLPDIWVANYERESFALYRNEGRRLFQHVSRITGVAAVGGLYVGWGTAFFDFDHDGDEDIFVTNGHVIRYPSRTTMKQTPLLFENRGGERLVNVAPQVGTCMNTPRLGRGLAVADLNNDGDQDLALSHINEPVEVFANGSGGANHWLSVKLVGTRASRGAVGAVVRIRTADREQMRQVKGGTSYASTNESRLFFGLGVHREIEWMEIRWPGGRIQELENVAADQQLTVIEP